MAAPRIFISMGTPYTSGYLAFREALVAFLRDQCDADPRIIGLNEYPSGSPLEHIRDVMRTCSGVIIVAYERKFLTSGIEKRGGNTPLPLSERVYTTPWNHIESAMAFCLGIPLYIICQNGLAEEGLIETKVDWYVQYVELTPEAVASTAMSRSLQAWITKRVVPHARKPRLLSGLTGQLRFSEITPRELMTVSGILFAAAVFGATVATKIPSIAALWHLVPR